MVDQLEASVAGIEKEVAAAEAPATRQGRSARDRLSAQQEWLAQARAGLDEFGG